MEIAIHGEGEVVIRFVDRRGRTLLQERVVVSGPPGVRALRHLSLSIGTASGPAELAPVVVSLSGREQRVTFDGQEPSRFAQKRCKAIGCSASVARDAARGVAPDPSPRIPIAQQPEMSDVLRRASRSKRGR